MKSKIKMLSTKRGRDDGGEARVEEYLKGVEYEVGPDLRKAFVVDLKVAVDVVEGKKAAGPAENKKAADAKGAETK